MGNSRSGNSPRQHGTWAVYLLLGAGAIAMVFPFIWQTLTAFKTFQDSVAIPPVIWPDPWVWTNFSDVLDTLPFIRMFFNSVALTIGRTVGQVVLCTMAGYAFARIDFPGRGPIFVLFLSVLMVPSQLYLLPQYEIMQALGWLDTLQALIDCSRNILRLRDFPDASVLHDDASRARRSCSVGWRQPLANLLAGHGSACPSRHRCTYSVHGVVVLE